MTLAVRSPVFVLKCVTLTEPDLVVGSQDRRPMRRREFMERVLGFSREHRDDNQYT
jgi:hypothetical protein